MSTPGGITGSSTTSPITVMGLTNGVSYFFQVVATNIKGNSNPSAASNSVMPGTVPGAPTLFSVTPGNGFIQASYLPTSVTNGAPITSYRATANPGGFTGTGASPIQINGLTNSNAYTVVVQAINSWGAGQASNSIVATPSNTATVPGSPFLQSLVNGNAVVSLSFAVPGNGGSPILGYYGFANNGVRVLNSTSISTPVQVTGLTNGQTENFTVCAYNAVGIGPPSNSIGLVIVGVPGPPLMVSATSGSSSTSVVSFTAPQSSGATAIQSYTVTSHPQGLTATGMASPIAVTGLTNGLSYYFTVAAANSVGTGPNSAPSATITPVGVPLPPANVTISSIGLWITVDFAAPPSNGGSPITSYTAYLSPGGASGSGSCCSITITSGVMSQITYTATVTATNSVGASAPSVPSNAVTPSSNTVSGKNNTFVFFSSDSMFRFVWSINPNTSAIAVNMAVNTNGWLSVGIAYDATMTSNDDYWTGWVDDTTGATILIDTVSPDYLQPREDRMDLNLVSGVQADGWTSISFNRRLDTGDSKGDIPITTGDLFLQWAFHPADGDNKTRTYPIHTVYGTAVINFFNGQTSEVTPGFWTAGLIFCSFFALVIVGYGLVHFCRERLKDLRKTQMMHVARRLTAARLPGVKSHQDRVAALGAAMVLNEKSAQMERWRAQWRKMEDGDFVYYYHAELDQIAMEIPPLPDMFARSVVADNADHADAPGVGAAQLNKVYAGDELLFEEVVVGEGREEKQQPRSGSASPSHSPAAAGEDHAGMPAVGKGGGAMQKRVSFDVVEEPKSGKGEKDMARLPTIARARRKALFEKKYGVSLLNRLMAILHWRLPFSQMSVLTLLTILAFAAVNVICLLADTTRNWGLRFGYLACGNAVLVAVPATRNSVLVWLLGFPFDRIIIWHQWIGLSLFAVSTLHGLWYYQQWINAGLDIYAQQISTVTNRWGGISWAAMLLLMVFSLNYFRRRHFNFFYTTHFLFLVFFTFAYFHVPSSFFPYIMAVVGIYGIDRAIRFYWGLMCNNTVALQVKGGNILRVAFRKHCFARVFGLYHIGQYVFVNFPDLSCSEWHPFSISSAPDEVNAEIHIRALGDHTTSLMERVKQGHLQSMSIRVDGPYGAHRMNYRRYPVVVLIAGGIGVTPMVSILKEIYNVGEFPEGYEPPPHRIETIFIVWTIPDFQNFYWFADEFKQFQQQAFDEAANRDAGAGAEGDRQGDVVRKSLPRIAQGAHGAEIVMPSLNLLVYVTRRAEGGNNIPEQYKEFVFGGRPDFDTLLNQVSLEWPHKSSIVFACGPEVMVNAAWDATQSQSLGGKRFDFHHETFNW